MLEFGGREFATDEALFCPKARRVAMLDLERLERDLIGRYPARWVHHHLASFPAEYFTSFEIADIARHLGLVLKLTEDGPVIVQPRPAGGDESWVEVIGHDAFQFLSTLCTLLAMRALSIVEGVIFTSRPP